MTIEAGGEAAVVDTTTGAEGAPVSSERDYEAEARKGGWKPQEEFSGDKDRWKDAKSWVEYGELRDSIRKDVAAEYEGRFAKLETMSKKAQTVIKQGYEAQIADLKAGRNEAIKKGDTALAEKYETAIDQTKDAAKDTGESPVEENVNAAFKKRNPWYGDDDDLTALAIVQSNAVSQAYTLKHGKPMPDNLMLEAVEKKVKATPEYQKKFGDKPSANGHADVDGGSSESSGGKRAKTWSDLPPEAKRAWDGFDPKIKAELPKEKYVKEYFADE